ncbi:MULTISPECIES: hypothetical protein [Acinetobacter]|uniref:Uncharacterized protein n=1 Tax=Acinetobacter higginsii TaxID=70347 RepID=N9SNH2_9GAMM|nr:MULTISPECIES: hypothetical protein [Acinetobacter]ENX56176.1 hypothetical protein F902_03273 [Acinetobacter higginsii]
MNAIKFIQQHGVEQAREVVDGAPEGAEIYVGITKTYFSSPSRLYDFDLSEWESMDRGMDLDLYEDQIWLEDLKRLVESVDKVNSFGGLEDAKAVVKMGKHYKYLEKAIADYESIYGGEHV